MVLKDILELDKNIDNIIKLIEESEYEEAYEILRSVVIDLLDRKKVSNMEWKLKITETLSIGFITVLKMYRLYGPELKDAPEEVLYFIKYELLSAKDNISYLAIPDDIRLYKISPN